MAPWSWCVHNKSMQDAVWLQGASLIANRRSCAEGVWLTWFYTQAWEGVGLKEAPGSSGKGQS